ncbi:hypothetical protein D3C75_879200 [compost metagenome]
MVHVVTSLMAVRGYQITRRRRGQLSMSRGRKRQKLAASSTISWGQQMPFPLKNNVFLLLEQHLSKFQI